ncbi:hypothetical protein FHW96_002065 [Novosphingobium sp. SG751A]|uniref:DUF1838 family protein n=1 Tax=Novosphingobium sp. SG751A TaxID=2587000 RepID=UPI001555DF06|nr:DUF1838 family protein [Novosphingobium sp. SG751A]NOW45907.1 hypothetical protein [Novosphingobium sp. SG751A]
MTGASRRAVLGGALGAGGLLLAAPALAAARGLDLAAPADRLKAFVKMRGSLDDRLIASWVSARYYGITGDEMRPLFNVRSAVFARYRPAPDGGYEAVNAEIAWFTDPDTGAVLTQWRNPYTGRDVKVPMGGYAPSKVFIRPDLGFALAKPVPGLEIEHEVLPFEVRGDDLYITERSRTAMRFAPGAKPFRYSESNTFHARLSDVLSGAPHVPSDVSFTNVCSWRPWMEMGDIAGHMSAIGIGKQGAAMESIPAEWQAATRQFRPEVLKDPAVLLTPLWNEK